MKLRNYRLSIVLVLLLFLPSLVFAQEVDIESLELVGKISYVGDDFNIYTYDFATSNITQLTEDGTRRAQYEFPTMVS